jgi:hypothetical protein
VSLIPDINNASPHNRSREPDPEQARAIKKWTAEILRLPDDAIVTVSELDCADPGCPIVETVIAVHDHAQSSRLWRFARPKAAITKLMLIQAITNPSGQLIPTSTA